MYSSAKIDPGRVRSLFEREQAAFRKRCPQSGVLAGRAKSSQLFGVPMRCMSQCPGEHALYVAHAAGAWLTDVDGHEYMSPATTAADVDRHSGLFAELADELTRPG